MTFEIFDSISETLESSETQSYVDFTTLFGETSLRSQDREPIDFESLPSVRKLRLLVEMHELDARIKSGKYTQEDRVREREVVLQYLAEHASSKVSNNSN